MRAFVGWMVMVLVSVGLGLALYSTSLKGSTTGYQEAAFTPMPTETVVKTQTKTKIVRKPAKTKIIYVEKALAPAPTVYVPQQNTSGSSAVSRSQSTDSGSSDDSHDAKSHDD